MTSPDRPENPSEFTPLSPEEESVMLLQSLAKEPNKQNFATVQAIFDEKLARAQDDIKAFRFILAYIDEADLDHYRRISGRTFYTEEVETPYTYYFEYKDLVPAESSSVKNKLARFIFRKSPPIQPSIGRRLRSVLESSPSGLEVRLPENWTDLVIKYVAFPNHKILDVPYRPETDTSNEETPTHTDEWEELKLAKIELARRYRAQDRGSGTDLTWWGYRTGIQEQIAVIEALHEEMGLVYDKDGFLISHPDSSGSQV